MSREVAGEEEGVTLAECLADGRIPIPEKMTFPKWQAWRKAEGRRPVRRRDGRGLTTEEEVALWRATMGELYGAREDDEDEEEEEQRDGDTSPELEPAERALVPLRGATGGAASGAGGSPRPSSTGTGAAGVEELLKKLKELFRPQDEDLSDYLARITRLVMALKSLGHEVAVGDLDRITLKAELIQETFGAVGSWDVRAMVRRLRDRFTSIALDVSLTEADKNLHVGAIGELIVGLGGRGSTRSDKLFSTPSVEPPAVGSPTREAVSLKQAGREGLERFATGGGDSPLRAKVAALEMELEALKRGSEASGGERDLAAALEAQTKTLQEALTAKQGQNSVTAVKTDVNWPTLTDDRSEARDVAQFYEEFEDCCSLANNCKGMSFREQLIALRARCRGSRLKTHTNIYRAAWKNGEVLEDPEKVYCRIKEKHLVFAESKEEKEVRVDNEHVLLTKGKMSAHQFEPLFEASISELESVGLGKTPRELYLSYLRKMPPHLQKEIRSDKRLWRGEVALRSPSTWEEAHRVVLEYEQREATHRATANAVYVAGPSDGERQPKLKKEGKDAKKPKPEAAVQKAASSSAVFTTQGSGGTGKSTKICFHFRDHGNCPKGADCPWSHDKELRKKVLAAAKASGGGKPEQTYAAKGGGGKGKKGASKGAGKGEKGKGSGGKGKKPAGTVCPFFQKNGSCRKGAECDMIHSLPTTGQGTGPPDGWQAPSGAAMSNPFAAFSVQIGSVETVKAAALETKTLSLSKPAGDKPRFGSLDDIPKDWFHLAENEPGGYQYKSVVSVLDRRVKVMLDGCAGSNHITEELVIGMLNRAADLGIKPEDKGFPIIRFERWPYPEYVHGIASGAPVPLRGAVVLRVRLLEGTSAESARDGPEIFVRCKIAAKGTSDWHGLILGGRALDCQAKLGLGFRPGPDAHIFDSLGIKVPRCEDNSRTRRDRAYPFISTLSSVDVFDGMEPGGDERQLLRYQGNESLTLDVGEGALIPVVRDACPVLDGSLCESVLPVEGAVEAVPGIWGSGDLEGMILVTSQEEEVTLEPGQPVAQV